MNLRRRRHKLQAREVGMNLIRRGVETESPKKEIRFRRKFYMRGDD